MVAQILAVIIFLAMFVLIVLEVWERHIITLGCGLLTLVLVFGLGMHSMSAVLETLNLGSFFTSHFWYTAGQSAEASSGINWETIVFVAGMMIMVEGMARWDSSAGCACALPRWSSIRLYRCLSPLWYYPVFWQCSLTVLP